MFSFFLFCRTVEGRTNIVDNTRGGVVNKAKVMQNQYCSQNMPFHNVHDVNDNYKLTAIREYIPNPFVIWNFLYVPSSEWEWYILACLGLLFQIAFLLKLLWMLQMNFYHYVHIVFILLLQFVYIFFSYYLHANMSLCHDKYLVDALQCIWQVGIIEI